jgi:hypothetical protein
MSNGEDFVPSLMKTKKNDAVGYPETFHAGFYLDNPAGVHTKAGLSPGEIQSADRNGSRHSFLLRRSRRPCRDRHTAEALTIKRLPRLAASFISNQAPVSAHV